MPSSETPRIEELGERYSQLRRRLAHYLLLQAYTFIETSGEDEIPSAMRRLIEKSAELKVDRVVDLPSMEQVEALSRDLATNMGETFNSQYRMEEDMGSRKVALEACGCIASVMEGADEFSLDPHLVRTIFCGSCMGGYREATERLGLEFRGKLTDSGCEMKFVHPK